MLPLAFCPLFQVDIFLGTSAERLIQPGKLPNLCVVALLRPPIVVNLLR